VTQLPLTLSCFDYDRTRALIDQRVRPEGIDLTYVPLMMPESAFRMLRFSEFHASEMSLSWYARTLFGPDPRPFVAIPVFPSRMFRHSSIYINTASGIVDPSDLRGKRIGCPEYQMTAAVWIKGILADEYDIGINSVSYHTGGLEQPGRTEVPFDLNGHISVEPIPTDRTLSSMLERGEIDALYTAHAPSCFTRGAPNIRRLFTDHRSVERDYLVRTGIFPIMHTIVIRTDVLKAHPWVAQSLTKAFERAKDLAYADLSETTQLKFMVPWLIDAVDEARELMGNDYWAYGLERNLTTLGTFLRYSHEQGLIPSVPNPEDLFAGATLETAKI
jgi:4,5-dihydroxyphthalate decarboxylase